MTDRILFLDFDGVLNSTQSIIYRRRKDGPHRNLLFRDDFCPIACSNLLYILEQLPDLKIVISSSWRLGHTMDQLKDILTNLGVAKDRVIDKTKDDDDEDKTRGSQIQEWLDRHPGVTQFVILDDCSDMDHLVDRLVKTSWMHGLLLVDVVKVFELLGEKHLIRDGTIVR